MNVPKLRFKEFNDDYTKSTLNQFAKKISNKNKNCIVTNVISNSAQFGLISQRDFFDKDIANDDNISGYYIIKTGDFVYNPRKSKEAPYGPINQYKYKEPGVISPLYLCFSIKNVNKNYLEYYFKSSSWHRYIYMNGDSGARHDRVSIKDDIFFNLPIYLPKDNEQEKISRTLELLDKKIELQSKKIEDLKLFKKGLINHLFKDMNIIESLKLKNICSIQTGKLDANAMIPDGKYRFYTCAKDFYYINEYAFDTEALLISGNGAYVGYIHYYKGKFNAYQRTYVLDNFKYDIQYIKTFLNCNLKQRIKSEKKEGNTPYIVLSTLSDMMIYFPSKNEQERIVYLNNNLDKKITYEEIVYQQLILLKKGLMQSMFV